MPWPCPMTQPKCAPLACCHDVALPWPCPGPLPGTTENDGSYNRQQPPTNQQPPLQYKASIIVPDCPGPER
ncbi:hypothetical protein M0804_014683 [Polistes exclamans]|nr:hypothetical protein M0804_014684 [Polistes exclamans]KAI4474761.1 hypothetical protein M0804_014683 [Polistes exclamans]